MSRTSRGSIYPFFREPAGERGSEIGSLDAKSGGSYTERKMRPTLRPPTTGTARRRRRRRRRRRKRGGCVQGALQYNYERARHEEQTDIIVVVCKKNTPVVICSLLSSLNELWWSDKANRGIQQDDECEITFTSFLSTQLFIYIRIQQFYY